MSKAGNPGSRSAENRVEWIGRAAEPIGAGTDRVFAIQFAVFAPCVSTNVLTRAR
jgi:hypothetical protein